MKRYILILISLLFLFGCAEDDGSTGSPGSSEMQSAGEAVTVKLMVFANEGMLKNYETVISRFNDSQKDISVEIQNVFGEDWTDYEQTMRSYLLSDKSPDIVDISVIYRDSMIEEGLLMDLMPFAEEAGVDFNLYFKNQFDGLIVDDSLYGIPSGALLMGVFINKDLFREAGVPLPSLDWEDTWTWEEFAEASRKIRGLSTTDSEVYGMTTSFTIGWILPFLMSAGSDFLSVHSGNCSATDEPALRTLAFLHELMFEDAVSPTIMEMITSQPYQYFIDGNLGMTIDGNWWMEAFRDSAEFDWGMVPMPIGEEVATGMYVDFWAVPVTSKHGEEAFQVLNFFLEENQQKSGIMKGIPALKTSAYDIYRDRFPSLSDEEIMVWFDGIRHGRVPAYFNGWTDFQNETTEVFRQFGLDDLTLDETAALICDAYLKQNKGISE